MSKIVNINGLKVINGFLKFKQSFSQADKKFVADPKGRFTLDLMLDISDLKHQELIKFIQSEQAEFMGTDKPLYDVIKNKSYVNKKGDKVDQTYLSLRSRDDVFVMDAEERRLKEDDLILPFGSVVNAVAEVNTYDFEDDSGNKMKGITLKLKEVTVLESAKKKTSSFSR